MKRFFTGLFAIALLLCLTACGGEASSLSRSSTAISSASEPAPSPTPEAAPSPEATPTTEPDSSMEPGEPEHDRSLVVYFSWSGNTEQVALEIAGQTGAPVFKLEPETPYTTDYNELLEIAGQEQRESARPTISGELPDLSGVNTVYFGCPIWWGDMPMILYSYLDAADLSGKTICPFVTSGGSGLSGTVETIREMEPDAVVTEGLSLGSGEAADCKDFVAAWLAELETN